MTLLSIPTWIRSCVYALLQLPTSKAPQRLMPKPVRPKAPAQSLKSPSWLKASISASPSSSGRYLAHLFSAPHGYRLYVQDRITTFTWCVEFADQDCLDDYLISLACKDYRTANASTPVATCRCF